LETYARRIRARAIRREGELLAQIEPQSKQNLVQYREAGDGPSARQTAAREAGLSPRQRVTALRVAKRLDKSQNETYASDAVKKAGKSKATVSRAVAPNEKIADVHTLYGTTLDKGDELDALTKLGRARRKTVKSA
jgi:hypothetical protein